MDDIIKDDQAAPGAADDLNEDKVPGQKDDVKPDDDKKVMVKIGDREVPLADIESWETDSKNKSDWQKSNTEKAQEIADQGKDLERYKSMAAYIDDPGNKEKADKIDKIINGIQEALPEENEFEDESVKALRTENAQMKQDIIDIKEDMSTKNQDDMVKQIETEEKTVRAAHANLIDDDIAQIYSMAKGNDGASLVETAEKYVATLKRHGEGSVNAYLKQKEEDGGSFLVGGGAPPTPAGGKTSLSDGSAMKSFAHSLAQTRST